MLFLSGKETRSLSNKADVRLIRKSQRASHDVLMDEPIPSTSTFSASPGPQTKNDATNANPTYASAMNSCVYEGAIVPWDFSFF